MIAHDARELFGQHVTSFSSPWNFLRDVPVWAYLTVFALVNAITLANVFGGVAADAYRRWRWRCPKCGGRFTAITSEDFCRDCSGRGFIRPERRSAD
jgi:phage terminase large subunit GpA-like protein